MPTSASWYLNGAKHATNDVIWTTDTIKVALTTSAYTPAQTTDEFFSSVTNELSGNGYTAGGVTLASKSVTLDTTNKYVQLLAGNVTFTANAGVQLTARRAVIYKSTGTAGTSPLLGWVDFGVDTSSGTGGSLVIAWDTTGVLRLNVL